MGVTKGGSSTDRFLHFSEESGEEEVGKDAGMTIQFPPQHFNFLLFLPDSVVPGPGLQLQGPEAGVIPKQETLTVLLNFYIRIPKGLM